MGIASIVLGILAFACALGGFLISFVPQIGAIPGALLSLSAPLLALIGVVLGGVAFSRAKAEGGETGLPIAGTVVSVIAFFPALFVALTCGLCDMLCANDMIQNRGRDRGTRSSPPAFYLQDAGLGGSPGLGPGAAPPLPPPPPPPGAFPVAPEVDPTATPSPPPVVPTPVPAPGDPPPPDPAP